MKHILCLLLACMALAVEAKEINVKSPDGKLVVTIDDEQGLLNYSVSYMGQTMLKPSALGLKADIGDFTRGLTFKEMKESSIDKTYTMTRAKASSAHYVARQADLTYTNSEGLPLTITFCVSNNDIAYRYSLQPKGESRLSAVIYNETSAFNFPEATTTFLTPQSLPMVGWQRTKPSYEEDYKADRPLTERSAFGEGFTFPCLFKVPAGWVLVSETGVGSNYCASHLSDYEAGRGYTVTYPNIGEMNGLGSHWAGIPLPGSTPWRTITVGTTLKPIVETTIPYDVVEPLYEPTQDYKPGRYTWSWLIWQDESVNYDDQVQFIDLASKMGYEYCLVDNWWDKNIGRERMAELSHYAQQKGVHLLLWYNSNGFWNDAPQTPRDCMNTAVAREREMKWMQSIGVKGIKVDFFGGDKQQTMQLYEDILTDANRYGLQVIFHGCTLPRGWERMYPNFVGSEAVLASENVFFSDYHARQEGFELTMHPFIRNAVASMDWGGVIMNKYLSKDNKSRHQRFTTNTFEMATGITNQCAVNCVALTPQALPEIPAFQQEFLKKLPTTWDETLFIDGYPGRYVVMARRHGSEWYVVALNGTEAPMELTVSLPMLAGQQADYYIDDVQLRTLKINKKGQARLKLPARGGAIINK